MTRTEFKEYMTSIISAVGNGMNQDEEIEWFTNQIADEGMPFIKESN